MTIKDNIIQDLIACKHAFSRTNIPWVIMGGVVLGYERYRDVMEWDTDLDIGIFTEINIDQWNFLIKSLYENGFNIKSKKTDFIVCRGNGPFNMWSFHKNKNYYEAFPKSTPGLKFIEKAIWYDEPRIVKFLNDKYPIPNNTDDYLDCQYGKDWRTNIEKNHEKYFLDKRGTRNMSQWPSGRGSKDGDMWPKIIKREETLETP